MNQNVLPVWLLLAFCCLLVGLISFIYTRGDRKKAFFITGIATLAIFAIYSAHEIETFTKTFFIGAYDQLGIPYKLNVSGFALFFKLWPLWVTPILICGIAFLLSRNPFKAETVKETNTENTIEPAEDPLDASEKITSKLHTEFFKFDNNQLKQQLQTQQKNNEELSNKFSELQTELEQTKEDYEDQLEDLQDRLNGYEVIYEMAKKEKERLREVVATQEEQIKKSHPSTK